MIEEWRNIDSEGFYQVSNLGNVRSWHNFNGSKLNEPKMMKPFSNGKNYQRVAMMINGKKVQEYIHRLVARAFIPNPGGKRCVNHIDCDPTNNTTTNLEWCTYTENKEHAKKHGRVARGESHGGSKLSAREVKEIRAIAKKRGFFYGRKQLADKYKVSEQLIMKIVNNDLWKHIEEKA